MQSALKTEALEDKLDELLFAALSSRRSASTPARRLGTLTRPQQDFVLRWVSIIARTNAEMAYQFASHAKEAFSELGGQGDVESWLIHAMDIFDRAGLYPALEAIREVNQFSALIQAKRAGVAFEEVHAMLSLFISGLSGRPLRVESATEVYTDTETLYLPSMLHRLGLKEDNYRLYKVTAVYLWAQIRFGTWRKNTPRALASFQDQGRALALFQALETIRLGACIARELPGIERELRYLLGLSKEVPYPPAWQCYVERLQQPRCTVEQSLAFLDELYRARESVPLPLSFQGRLFPERVQEVMTRRLGQEKEQLQVMLARLKREYERERNDATPNPIAFGRQPFTIQQAQTEDTPHELEMQLLLSDKPIPTPEDVQALMMSIFQDLGEIPDDYLYPAGEGSYCTKGATEADLAVDVWKGTYHEKGAYLYDEWDFRRQHYRKHWCVIRELNVHPHEGTFAVKTLRRYARYIVDLRKGFEAIRGEDRRVKREPRGDEIDIDALVEAYADAHSGLEMSERLFTKLEKVERSIAVMFMVDMSGSTKGWINDAERESLLLLGEALNVLGDRYAIYGFSGMTRKRCEVYRIKRFEEPYGEEIQARIAGISPKDYTRMGVAIRHLAYLLNQVDARTRLLITLSDGKPDDYGTEYRGEYGIEDTRQALIEAKRDGIHPFCITIDREGADYLPHMYGPVNYTIVDAVEKLPLRVSNIYRRLTT